MNVGVIGAGRMGLPIIGHLVRKGFSTVVFDIDGTKRAAVQDLVQRLNKARLWSLDHLTEYAMSTAELTKLPEDVLLQAYTAQRTSPIAIDENVIKEVQEASDRSTRYGILPRKLDVNKAVDRSFTAAANLN